MERSASWETADAQLTKNSPSSYENRVQEHATVDIYNQMNPILTFLFHKRHFNIMYLPRYKSPKWYYPSSFPAKRLTRDYVRVVSLSFS